MQRVENSKRVISSPAEARISFYAASPKLKIVHSQDPAVIVSTARVKNMNKYIIVAQRKPSPEPNKPSVYVCVLMLA